MKYKSFLFVTLCLLSSVSADAQIEYDVIRPSINASQFDCAVKAETALSKGQVSLNIPLMELKGKGYNLPISVVFYNGDVTFRTESSPIGLGWALMAGGVITKTIKGSDDMDQRTNHDHQTNPNYMTERFADWRNHSVFTDDIRFDPMPDEYTYSLPGHSGTVDVSFNNGVVNEKLYPDESYIIEETNNGVCITADDGTKFYFEDRESRTVVGDGRLASTSWFLSRIVTTKGGLFTFNYDDEDYADLTPGEDGQDFETFHTKRITSIVSDYGTVEFYSERRSDRGSWHNARIAEGNESERINKIELRDESGAFVKGYELDNSGWFTHTFASAYPDWTDCRHKLSSITQYDADGNHLPPYEFDYSYKFDKSRLAEIPAYSSNNGEFLARDSWTSYVGPQAYVDLKLSGEPSCHMVYPNTPYTYLEGITIRSEYFASTVNDYFCLSYVTYPTGATEEFIYENHNYSKVNRIHAVSGSRDKIAGKRLASKIRYGEEVEQRTDYVYQKHDSDYNVLPYSSGVLTNPSIHCATYYTLGSVYGYEKYIASRITSEMALNTYMGTPVCYTEVEEVEKDRNGSVLGRTIHYFEPNIVNPPVNYIFTYYDYISREAKLTKVENRIYGTKSGYESFMQYCNDENLTYLAYPVGEFTNDVYVCDQPLKEVFIGKDGNVRSVSEYQYRINDDYSRFGYKVEKKDFYDPTTENLNYTVSWISRSEYMTRRTRLSGINTTRYYYDEGNACDSICEYYGTGYNKGRVSLTTYTRGNDERKTTRYYFPGDILNTIGSNTSTNLTAINGLIDKNIVADPIKTVIKRNGVIIGGECKDYQTLSDMPLLRSIYKIKNTSNNYDAVPVVNGSDIDYNADLYKEGEIITYDVNYNPEHVRINETQDRIYVWGYGGRFPIAIIDNMDYATYSANTSLRNMIMRLVSYRKIESEDECMSLRNRNNAIRALLPEGAHITTYTYDPYFGMTSEMDDSNLGTIYTYDSFGRLSAKYDTYFNKTEEYEYNLYLQ